MTEYERAAYAEMIELGAAIRKLIATAKSSQQPLTLPADCLAKLTEAEQAIFAAQREMEKGV